MTRKSDSNHAARPRITIITPTRNAVRYVTAAVESVVRQNYPNFEHIVVDNCSSDGTLECLARFPHLRVVSELDHGAHDAMNKGIELASGEIIGFLNADDLYSEGLFDAVGRIFSADAATDMVTVPTVVFAADNRGQPAIVVARDHDRDAGLWLAECVFGAPGFNGRFFRRRTFERVGVFDNGYYIAADRHLLLRAILAGVRARHAGKGVALCYRSHSGSATLNPERRQSVVIAREHMRMAGEFTQSPFATSGQRRVFRAWYAFESVKLAWRAAAAGRLGAAASGLGTLVLHQPLWPWRLVRAFLLRRAVRQMTRTVSDIAIPVGPAVSA